MHPDEVLLGVLEQLHIYLQHRQDETRLLLISSSTNILE